MYILISLKQEFQFLIFHVAMLPDWPEMPQTIDAHRYVLISYTF